jgi:hypothetical protein
MQCLWDVGVHSRHLACQNMERRVSKHLGRQMDAQVELPLGVSFLDKGKGSLPLRHCAWVLPHSSVAPQPKHDQGGNWQLNMYT